jgi:hypothetical protein
VKMIRNQLRILHKEDFRGLYISFNIVTLEKYMMLQQTEYIASTGEA